MTTEEKTAKRREANRRWRKAHPEKVRAASAKWRAAHPEKVKELSKRWYLKVKSTIAPAEKPTLATDTPVEALSTITTTVAAPISDDAFLEQITSAL